MTADANRPADDASPEQAEPGASDSFGTWLRRQREGRQIALREIADASKISLRYLQALEADRFDVLPAPVFAKGFLRQYARYVGLDSEDVINFYISARQAQDDEAAAPEEERTGGQGSGLPSGGKLLLLVVILLGLVAALFYWNERRQAAADAAVGATPTATRPTPPAPDRSTVPANVADPATETNAAPTADEPGSSTDGDAVDGADTETTGGPAPTAPSPDASAAAIRVSLDFRAECWVQARADGRRALSETKVQGESVDLEAEETLELIFGDGGAVTVEVNGQPYAFDATPGRVVRLTIDQAALEAQGSEGTTP